MKNEKEVDVLTLGIGDWVLIADNWVMVQCLRGVYTRTEGLMIEISGDGFYKRISVRDKVIVLAHG